MLQPNISPNFLTSTFRLLCDTIKRISKIKKQAEKNEYRSQTESHLAYELSPG